MYYIIIITVVIMNICECIWKFFIYFPFVERKEREGKECKIICVNEMMESKSKSMDNDDGVEM